MNHCDVSAASSIEKQPVPALLTVIPEAVDVASAALEKYNIEKDIAAQIKKEFDKRHGPTWHVVVGKNFGSYVTHCTPFVRLVCGLVHERC